MFKSCCFSVWFYRKKIRMNLIYIIFLKRRFSGFNFCLPSHCKVATDYRPLMPGHSLEITYTMEKFLYILSSLFPFSISHLKVLIDIYFLQLMHLLSFLCPFALPFITNSSGNNYLYGRIQYTSIGWSKYSYLHVYWTKNWLSFFCVICTQFNQNWVFDQMTRAIA